MSTKSYGDIGEDYAVKLILSKGYAIVERNFRSKFGEIDIIAKDKEVLVFVEVKTRWSKRFGTPEEAVTPTKLKKIKKTIDYYLMRNNFNAKAIRIEVVAIVVRNKNVQSAKIIKVD